MRMIISSFFPTIPTTPLDTLVNLLGTVAVQVELDPGAVRARAAQVPWALLKGSGLIGSHLPSTDRIGLDVTRTTIVEREVGVTDGREGQPGSIMPLLFEPDVLVEIEDYAVLD
ncbi:hypothetical protein [Arthrobacter cupressi]|uniref:hypothetical protein n=1 Tax=Arthrobacter cupressi TaxID=1045773 RepID=UPI001114449C|nr:hypothetical protein [Arthrobacter cupressi]NYD77663.1 hypothetical protein [Arthrobacter cupressi]